MAAILILLIILLNAFNYGYLFYTWNELSYESCVGRSFLSIFITVVSIILIFNVNQII